MLSPVGRSLASQAARVVVCEEARGVSPSVAVKRWLVALSFSSGSTAASFNLADE